MKKLILFIHGIGGSRETWGEFPNLIWADEEIVKDDFEFVSYEYSTSLIDQKATLSLIGTIGSFLMIPYASAVASGVSTVLNDLPNINELAILLDSRIEITHSQYEDIYIIAHSMGGLIAQKYIVDILNHEKSLKVKKLMLYDVPNHGSSIARISAIYKHKQGAQLDRNSEFITELNRRAEFKKIDQRIDTKYVVCLNGSVVDTNSATSGFKDALRLERTHKEIVKPKSSEDEVYMVWKNFIRGIDDKFIRKVIETLIAEQLVVLFYQNSSDIVPTQRALRVKAKSRFANTIYDFRVPSTEEKAEYYKALGEVFGAEFASSHDFEKHIKSKLNAEEEVFLYVTEFEKGKLEINREFASSLQNLKAEDKKGFFALVVGREKLYELAYNKDSKLSPLNKAKKFYFPNNANLDDAMIENALPTLAKDKKALIQDLKSDTLGSLSKNNRQLYRLFWENMLSVEIDSSCLKWRDIEMKAKIKKILSCR